MDIEPFLDNFDLSEYEKKAYVALLRMGKAKSRIIAKESGVSYGRIYEILDKLEEKGLVTVFPTEPKLFEAIDPKKGLTQMVAQREEHLHDLKKLIPSLQLPKTRPSTPEDKTTVIQGKQKQIAMIGEMHERAKKEILLIPGVYELTEKRKAQTIRALTRGVNICLLLRKVTPKNKVMVEKGRALGEEIRLHTLKGLRLVVRDGEEALLSIVNPKTKERISIHTTNKAFASSMGAFFHALWIASKELR